MIYGTPIAGVDLAAKQFWKVEGEEGMYLMNDGDVESGMIDATRASPSNVHDTDGRMPDCRRLTLDNHYQVRN